MYNFIFITSETKESSRELGTRSERSIGDSEVKWNPGAPEDGNKAQHNPFAPTPRCYNRADLWPVCSMYRSTSWILKPHGHRRDKWLTVFPNPVQCQPREPRGCICSMMYAMPKKKKKTIPVGKCLSNYFSQKDGSYLIRLVSSRNRNP